MMDKRVHRILTGVLCIESAFRKINIGVPKFLSVSRWRTVFGKLSELLTTNFVS